MVHMVDVAFAERFLLPTEIGSVPVEGLRRGGGAQASGVLGWDADEWVTTDSTDQATAADGVVAALQQTDKTVLYLRLPHLANITVEQALDALPRELRCASLHGRDVNSSSPLLR
jgi:hypothetical protein